MIAIKKGNRILTVTRGAFKSMYQRTGYHIVDPEETMEDSPDHFEDGQGYYHPEEETGAGEDLEEPEEEYKPLSEMDLEELKEYAKELGISRVKDMNKKELRKAIREKLND